MTQIQTVSWAEFQDAFQWEQGEHLTLIGPTKSGKSTLARHLLKDARRNGTHPWQVVLATKRRDEVLDDFGRDGFERIPEWIVTDPDLMRNVMVAPPLSQGIKSVEQQKRRFRYTLESIFRQGGWLVYLDELRHITNFLGLEREVELLLHQGRSAGITVVGSVQRPRHVPLMAYDQATHLFFWETNDLNMRKRLSELGGKVDPDMVQYGVQRIQYHEFLYVNPRSGQVLQSVVEL